jgi:hypothetical protein
LKLRAFLFRVPLAHFLLYPLKCLIICILIGSTVPLGMLNSEIELLFEIIMNQVRRTVFMEATHSSHLQIEQTAEVVLILWVCPQMVQE